MHGNVLVSRNCRFDCRSENISAAQQQMKPVGIFVQALLGMRIWMGGDYEGVTLTSCDHNE